MKKDAFISVQTEIHWLTEQLYNLTLLPHKTERHMYASESTLGTKSQVCVCVLWSLDVSLPEQRVGD